MGRKGGVGSAVPWLEGAKDIQGDNSSKGRATVCKLNGALREEWNSWSLLSGHFSGSAPVDLSGRGEHNKKGVKLKRAVSLTTLLRAVFNNICNNGSWGWGCDKGHLPTQG